MRQGVFISYRRMDSQAEAGRLFDRLEEDLGRDRVFKDVDSIRPGENFPEVIARSLRETEVVLVLIGPRWLLVRGDDGQRRLDDPEDFVRLEVEAALASPKRVIPVLVGGAAMPSPDELPETLRPLVQRNAMHLRPDPDFRPDAERILTAVTGRKRSGGRRPWRWIAVLLILALLALAVAGYLWFQPVPLQKGAAMPSEGLPAELRGLDRNDPESAAFVAAVRDASRSRKSLTLRSEPSGAYVTIDDLFQANPVTPVAVVFGDAPFVDPGTPAASTHVWVVKPGFRPVRFEPGTEPDGATPLIRLEPRPQEAIPGQPLTKRHQLLDLSWIDFVDVPFQVRGKLERGTPYVNCKWSQDATQYRSFQLTLQGADSIHVQVPVAKVAALQAALDGSGSEEVEGIFTLVLPGRFLVPEQTDVDQWELTDWKVEAAGAKAGDQPIWRTSTLAAAGYGAQQMRSFAWKDDGKSIVAAGSGGLFLSEDRGETWEPVPVTTSGPWKQVLWVGVRWAAITDFHLFVSETGRQWDLVPGLRSIFYGVAANPNGCVLVGDAIFHGSSAGGNWKQVAKREIGHWLHCAASSPEIFVAAGAEGAILISENGQDWEPVVSPTRNDLHAISYDPHAKRFVIVGRERTVLSSADSRKWRLHPGPDWMDNPNTVTASKGRVFVGGAAPEGSVSRDLDTWQSFPLPTNCHGSAPFDEGYLIGSNDTMDLLRQQ